MKIAEKAIKDPVNWFVFVYNITIEKNEANDI